MSQHFASILGLSLTGRCAVTAPTGGSPTGVSHRDLDRTITSSVLVIQSVGADGSVTGTYANNAPGYKCAGVALPLVGWMDGQRISYTVLWKNASVDCSSITSWTGYFNGGRLGVEWVGDLRRVRRPHDANGSDSYTRQ